MIGERYIRLGTGSIGEIKEKYLEHKNLYIIECVRITPRSFWELGGQYLVSITEIEYMKLLKNQNNPKEI